MSCLIASSALMAVAVLRRASKRSPSPDSPRESGGDSAPARHPKRSPRSEPRGELPRESGLDSAPPSHVPPDPDDVLPPVDSPPVGRGDPSSDALASTPVSSFEPAAGPRAAAAAAADSGESDTEGGDSDGSDPEGIDGVGAGESTGGPELSESVSSSRSVRERSNRIVSAVAYDAKMLTAQEDLVDFAALDRDEVSRLG